MNITHIIISYPNTRAYKHDVLLRSTLRMPQGFSVFGYEDHIPAAFVKTNAILIMGQSRLAPWLCAVYITIWNIYNNNCWYDNICQHV